MNAPRAGRALVAAWLLAGAAAQGEPPADRTVRPGPARGTAPATLHAAWLAETLDLDLPRAVTLYREVAARHGPGNLDRWVAAARLVELQRLGVPGIGPIDLAEAPRDLREKLGPAPAPIDQKALLQQASGDLAGLLQSLATAAVPGTDGNRLPPMRPFVHLAESWLLDQVGPSPRDRTRQQREAFANRARFTDRINASKVLIAELENRRDQADALRALHFAAWQPPAVAADHQQNLARFRQNLEDMLTEREVTGSLHALLLRLRTTVEKAAETDPAAAVGLLLRLPQYAERLLRETAGQGR